MPTPTDAKPAPGAPARTGAAADSAKRPTTKQPTALLVLGMHRSGTSALTRVVNLLGVDLGTDLMEAAEGNNERGFWEHQGVVDRHDRLLADLGMRWDDPRAMPADWLQHPATRSARRDLEAILDAEFDGSPLWGVKDPRMCRLLPLWREMLEARGVRVMALHMLRHPMEIARSLERRDGMPRGRALLLWLRHQIEALAFSDGLPQSWASFDRLMARWRDEMVRVDGDLHLGFAGRMDAAAGEIDLRDNRIRTLDQGVLERDAWVAERDSRIAERERQIVALDGTIASLNVAIDDLREDVDDLKAEIETRDGHINALAGARSDLQKHIAAMEASTSWRLTTPVRMVGTWLRRLRRVTHILTPGELFRARHVEGDIWEATDTFPVMVLQSNRIRMPTGWVKLTYSIKADKIAAPSLFADLGSGTTEIDRKRLPVTNGETVTCFVRLPDEVKGLRLDPISWEGRFEMGPITAREITRFELLRELASNAYADEGVRPMIGNLRRGGIKGLKEYLIKKLPTPIETYEDWRDLFYSLTDGDRAAIRAHIARMKTRPTFSVVMPTYETPPALLEKAVESVKAQLYGDWELCIADDGSKSAETRAMLERYAAEEPRIKVVFRETNGHISAATNSALELATGEWVALLDHDDELTEDALYWMAASLEADPDADILYSDEDKIDEEGRLSDPYFKPNWSPELFLSQNMINHLGVYRRSLVEKAGRFREGFEGSQDYDLALRVLEQTTPERVRHVPVVLYHWRTVAGSVALATGEKTYPYERARTAIAEHLGRSGVKAEVVAGQDGFSHRVRPALPAQKPHVTIIVPTRDRLDMMRMVVTGLLETTSYPNWDLIIVDNGSEKTETLEYFAEIQADKRITVLRDDAPFNFSRLNNRAVETAKGPLILLLNNDIEPIEDGWLEEMVRQLQRPGVGAVGAKLYYPNDTVQHVGVTTGIGGVAGHFDKHLPRDAPGYFSRAQLVHNVSATTAACLLTTKKIYRQIGGMNENELKVAFNDVDFCLKIRAAGHRIVLTPYAELYHHESVSRGLEDTAEKRARFRSEMLWMRGKWGKALDADPYFNPNLSLDQETPVLAVPPRVDKPWESRAGDSGAGDDRKAAAD